MRRADDRAPTATEAALAEAQRAMDNAIRTMFELAYRLEFLREAIERANTEMRSQVRDYGRISGHDQPISAEGAAIVIE